MTIIDNRTANRNYKRPATGNFLSDDRPRLDDALIAIDADVAAALAAIAGKVDAATLAGYILASTKNQANGVAGLNGSGQIDESVIPLSLLGGLNPRGTWNAAANSPAIPAASSANKSWYWIVATAGSTSIDGENDWNIGDWIISTGTQWKKIDNTDRVASVAGKTGVVTLAKADVGLPNVDNTADAAKSFTASQISDGGTTGKGILQAATVAAVKTILGYVIDDIGSLGASVLTALKNAVNTASGFVQLTAAGKYPALDGSLITGISAGDAGPWTTVIRTTDGTVANSATPADDAVLQLAVTSGLNYVVEFFGNFNQGGNSGVRWAVAGPAMTTFKAFSLASYASVTTGAVATATGGTMDASPINTPANVGVHGRIEFTPSANGTFKIQHSGVNNFGSGAIYKGSRIRWRTY